MRMLWRKPDMTCARCIACWRGSIHDRPQVGFFACFHAIYLERSRFRKICHFSFRVGVVLKPLVSLMDRLVTCSARIRVDRQTDGQLDRQNDYCNPRCACAPRLTTKSCSLETEVYPVSRATCECYNNCWHNNKVKSYSPHSGSITSLIMTWA